MKKKERRLLVRGDMKRATGPPQSEPDEGGRSAPEGTVAHSHTHARKFSVQNLHWLQGGYYFYRYY